MSRLSGMAKLFEVAGFGADKGPLEDLFSTLGQNPDLDREKVVKGRLPADACAARCGVCPFLRFRIAQPLFRPRSNS
eukprot:645530-Pleurochrysis_carterae.AAC.1